MKMFVFLLLLITLLTGLLSGCALLLGEGPKLGQYRYTQMELYRGVTLKTIPIWVDKGFGESDRLAIDDAVRAWNYALNGYIKLNIVDFAFDMEIDKIVRQVNTGGWLFMRIDHDNPMVPIGTDKGFWTIGFTETIGGHHLYLVRDRLANESVLGVTMHEIGHLLGSPHVGDRLMYPHFTRARFQCVDQATIWEVAVYQGIPPDRLNYCVDTDSSSEITKKPSSGEVSGPACPLGSPVVH